MTNKSMLLKASILLTAPLLMAYGSSSDEGMGSDTDFSFGVEVQGNAVTASWHTKSTASVKTLAKMTSGIHNAGAWSYQEGGDKLPNYTFGGRALAKSSFSDDFAIMVAFGFETGMKDANVFKPVNQGTGTSAPSGDANADVTQTEWDAQDTTGTAKWANNLVMTPAIYIGYGSLYLGAQYDMREYEITGHDTGLTTYLNKTVKDNQPLFGFRGEQCYEMDDLKLVVSAEYMTNLGRAADTDMGAYWKDVAKYTPDVTITLADTDKIIHDGATAAGTYVAPASRLAVSATNSLVQKASLGLCFFF